MTSGGPSYRFCADCGTALAYGTRFCVHCGSPAGEQVAARAPVPPVVRRLLDRHDGGAREAWFRLAAVLLNQDRRAEASSALDHARDEPGTSPTDAELGVLRAWTLDRSAEPALAVRAYLDAALLDPTLVADVLPAARALLAAEEAALLVPWIRSTWLPRLSEVPAVDRHPLALFRATVAVVANDGADAVDAVAEAIRTGTGPHPVAVADTLVGLADPPVTGASWRLLVGLALARLGEHVGALRFVCEAQEWQLPEAGPFGEADSRVAEADLLDVLTPGSAEADTRRYEAASLLAARGDHERAIEQFERSATRWGDNPELHWSWADSIRLATYQRHDLDPTEVYERIMARWQVGTDLALPDESSAWAYLVPAFAAENLSWSLPNRPRDVLWRACLLAERTLRLDETNMAAHLLLARCHRTLENYATAAVSVRAALDAQPVGSTDASDEHAVLLSFLAPDEAREALADAAESAVGEDQRARWELALAAAQLGHEQEALDLLSVLTPDAADPWQLWAYAWVLRMSGRDEEARTWFTTLLGTPSADSSWTWFLAYAAYALGELGTAEAETGDFLVTVDQSSHRRHDFLVLLGLIQLAKHDVTAAERTLVTAAQLIRTRRDALDAAADLRLIGRQDDVVAEAARSLAGVFERRAAELSTPELGVDAASAELAELGVDGPESARLAGRATLARLRCTPEHAGTALADYRDLLGHRDVFPEAAIGLFEAGVLAADRAFAAADPALALRRLREIRQPLADAADARVPWSANVAARESLALFWLGDPSAGHALFAEIVAEARPSVDAPGVDIGDFWRDLVPTPAAYWAVVDAVGDPTDPDLAMALERLHGVVDDVLGCGPGAENTDGGPDEPDLVVCGLTIGSGLVPADRGPDGPLFTELLPTVYRALEQGRGVTMPPVRVTEDPGIDQDEYRIELWGSPLRTGRAGSIEEVTDLLGETLLANVSQLACLDLADDLLDRWAAGSAESPGRATIDDDSALAALTTVLRGLLDRGLSVADGRPVLATFDELEPGEVVATDELVERTVRRIAAREEEPR